MPFTSCAVILCVRVWKQSVCTHRVCLRRPCGEEGREQRKHVRRGSDCVSAAWQFHNAGTLGGGGGARAFQLNHSGMWGRTGPRPQKWQHNKVTGDGIIIWLTISAGTPRVLEYAGVAHNCDTMPTRRPGVGHRRMKTRLRVLAALLWEWGSSPPLLLLRHCCCCWNGSGVCLEEWRRGGEGDGGWGGTLGRESPEGRDITAGRPARRGSCKHVRAHTHRWKKKDSKNLARSLTRSLLGTVTV